MLRILLGGGEVAALVRREGPSRSRSRVAEEVLDDLRERLARTRWPAQPAEEGWELGVDIAYLRELCDHWAGRYDWRAFERG